MRITISLSLVLLLGGLAVGCEKSVGPVDAGPVDAGIDAAIDAALTPPLGCGNGVLDSDEECDDGNQLDDDGCDRFCRTGPCSSTPEVCNGLDDDCDGRADEENVCACTDASSITVVHQELLAGPGEAVTPSLVWNGNEYGAGYSGGFARLDTGGRVLESSPSAGFSGSAAGGLFFSEALGRYVTCYSSMEDVYCGQRGAAEAEALVTKVVDRPEGSIAYSNPKVAYNSDAHEIGIVYPTGLTGVQRYDLVILDTNFNTLYGPTQVNEIDGFSTSRTALSWNGTDYAFVYQGDFERLYFRRISPTGELQGSEAILTVLPMVEYLGNLLWDGEAYQLAFSTFLEIMFLRIAPSGQVLTTTQVTHRVGSELVYTPTLALGHWTGMVWGELASADSDQYSVFFTVLDASGIPQRAEPLLLSAQGLGPWIASNGETFVASWREGSDIWDPDIAFAHLACP